jgi:hypothetical protein
VAHQLLTPRWIRHTKRQYCPCFPQLPVASPLFCHLRVGPTRQGHPLPPPIFSSLPPSTKHGSAFRAFAPSAPLSRAARSAAAVRWGTSGKQSALFTRSSPSGRCVAAYPPERGSGQCWRVALPRTAHEDPGKKLQAVAGRLASPVHGPERPIAAARWQLDFFPGAAACWGTMLC